MPGGERLTPSHAVKKNRRYRYYVSAALITEAGTDRAQAWRLAAREIEEAVIRILADALTSPASLVERFGAAGLPSDQIRNCSVGRPVWQQPSVAHRGKSKARWLAALEDWLCGRDYLENRFTAEDLRILRCTEIVSGRPALRSYQGALRGTTGVPVAARRPEAILRAAS